MEARRTAIACCAAVLVCGLASGSASAAAPKAGGHYHGPSVFALPTSLTVSKDGSRVSKYFLTVRLKCSDGSKHKVFLDERREPAATIDPAGRFAVETPSQAGHLTLHHKRVKVLYQSTVNGTFETEATVRGSITTRARRGKTTCDGTRPFSVFLDGTRGAAYRNGLAATGRYSAKGRGIRVGAFRVQAPAHLLTGLRIRARDDKCRPAGVYPAALEFNPLVLSKGRIRVSERVRRRIGGGQVARERYRLTLRLYRRRGAYRVAGSFRDTARIYKHGKRLARCHSGTRHFGGRFLSGPKNLF